MTLLFNREVAKKRRGQKNKDDADFADSDSRICEICVIFVSALLSFSSSRLRVFAVNFRSG
jgi:hypothetical protein